MMLMGDETRVKLVD